MNERESALRFSRTLTSIRMTSSSKGRPIVDAGAVYGSGNGIVSVDLNLLEGLSLQHAVYAYIAVRTLGKDKQRGNQAVEPLYQPGPRLAIEQGNYCKTLALHVPFVA